MMGGGGQHVESMTVGPRARCGINQHSLQTCGTRRWDDSKFMKHKAWNVNMNQPIKRGGYLEFLSSYCHNALCQCVGLLGLVLFCKKPAGVSGAPSEVMPRAKWWRVGVSLGEIPACDNV